VTGWSELRSSTVIAFVFAARTKYINELVVGRYVCPATHVKSETTRQICMKFDVWLYIFCCCFFCIKILLTYQTNFSEFFFFGGGGGC